MITWGIVANSHDASIGVFDGHTPVWAGMAKDFSGKPNDPHLNWEMIQHLRIKEQLRPDKIVWYEYPRLKGLRQWWAGQGLNWKENNIPQYLSQWNIDLPIEYTKHHLSHAAYGYYTYPTTNDSCHTRWAIVVLDSIGEFECFTIWQGLGGNLRKVYSQRYPHSIGLWYSAMTQRLGLKPNAEEYKVCEMAAKGDPERFRKVIMDELFANGFKDLPAIKFNVNCHRGIGKWLPGVWTEQDLNDLAAGVQTVFEDIIINISAWVKSYVEDDNVIFMGGCALNKPAIDKVRESGMFKNIYVPKNPGDPGSCLGAVFAKTKIHVDFKDNIWYNKHE